MEPNHPNLMLNGKLMVVHNSASKQNLRSNHHPTLLLKGFRLLAYQFSFYKSKSAKYF